MSAALTPTVIAFDELPLWVGRSLGVSDWVRINQGLIDRYADLTGDHNWIHADTDRARAAGGPIAHGMLILSLFPTLLRQISRVTGVGRSLNYGHDRLRYVGPTPSGARVRLRQGLKALEARGDGFRLTWDVVIEVEGAERPAIVTDWIVILYP